MKLTTATVPGASSRLSAVLSGTVWSLALLLVRMLFRRSEWPHRRSHRPKRFQLSVLPSTNLLFCQCPRHDILPLIDPVLGPHVPCLKPLPSFVPFHAGKNGGRSAASRSNCTIRPAGDVG